MKVAEVMQRSVVSVRPDETLPLLDEVMTRHRITGVPVLDGDQVVGVVSRTDVVRQLEVERARFEDSSWYLEPFDSDQRPFDLAMQVSEAVAARLQNLHVRDLMTKQVLSVAPEAELEEAARCMVEHRVHRLLVLDAGRLVGLVSSLDLLRGFAGLA